MNDFFAQMRMQKRLGGLILTVRPGEAIRVNQDFLVLIQERRGSGIQLRIVAERLKHDIKRLNREETRVFVSSIIGEPGQ